MELLAEARRRFGDEETAKLCRVKRNQLHVWVSRQYLSKAARIALENALDAPRPADTLDATARLAGYPELRDHLIRQTEYLALIPALRREIEGLRQQLADLLAERVVDPVAIVRAEIGERAAARVAKAIAAARQQDKTG